MGSSTTCSEPAKGHLGQFLDQRATRHAWEEFLTFQDLERSRHAGVRPEILDSWSRSLASGINAQARVAPLSAQLEELAILAARSQHLRDAAQGPFRRIAPLLTDSQAILLLTDEQGLVLEQIGDTHTQEAGESIHLTRGGMWSEAMIGTNGIGTALRLGQPTVVHAFEHFCEGINAWTCAAAPIHDPVDQRILGVVDLSGPPEIFRPHNLVLAQTVAREIESVLGANQVQRRSQLLEAFLNSASAHGKDDAVIILDHLGRVVYHRQAMSEANSTSARDTLATGQRLLDLSQAMSDHDIQNALPQHLRPSGISRLILNGTFSGAALILPERQRGLAAKPQAAAEPLRIPSRMGALNDELLVIGRDPGFLAAIELAKRAASAGTPVLIQGETGTGKELFARLFHGHGSKKTTRPFITLNCGAVSAELFGAELFGHVAGAFTGASREGKPGKFELADSGVLCLDEIGEMPLELQPYLLRVLEQRAVYRIGCARRRQIDVQLVAMTNRILEEETQAGKFRRDLYYRISAVTIDVPPLRARAGDVPLLFEHFNRQTAARLDRTALQVTAPAMVQMQAYGWPGNVRELRNMVERLYLNLEHGSVDVADLPLRLGGQPLPEADAAPTPRDPVSLNDLEARAIREMLVAEGGNLTRVATALGISRPTLYRKLKAYGLRRQFN